MLGIDFISYSEQVDTSTPMGKAMFTMISAMAEFERSLIQERVCAGLKHAIKRGVKLGRPRVGFDVNKALRLKDEGFLEERFYFKDARQSLYGIRTTIPVTPTVPPEVMAI